MKFIDKLNALKISDIFIEEATINLSGVFRGEWSSSFVYSDTTNSWLTLDLVLDKRGWVSPKKLYLEDINDQMQICKIWMEQLCIGGSVAITRNCFWWCFINVNVFSAKFYLTSHSPLIFQVKSIYYKYSWIFIL